MASRIYRTRAGTDLIAIAGTNWQVGGVRVDNPTGSWLLVSSINQYVPPYTNGWIAQLVPSAASIDVRFVDSPSGSRSVNVGNPLTVTLYDAPIGVSAGFPSGSGARIATAPLYETAFAISDDDGAFVTIATAGVNEVLIIRRLAVSGSAAPTHPPLLMTFYNSWSVSPAPPTPYVGFAWKQSIDPERTYTSDVFEDGTAIVFPGGVLRCFAATERPTYITGSGALAEVQFYREVRT